MPKLHIIYIPGLGDDKSMGQEKVVKTWRLYGVEPEFFNMYWAEKRSWEDKFKILLARIDELAEKGNKVGLVGASAGATAVINAFAARKDKMAGVVLIAGKVNHPETIGQKVRETNPSFITSAYAAENALKNLGYDERKRILSIYSVKDGLLTHADSHISGARNRYTLIMGHPIVIALQITLGAVGFIWFLKRIR